MWLASLSFRCWRFKMTEIEVASSAGLEQKEVHSTELLDRLDLLLEQYLVLLDQYQTARQELSSLLASGFISVAQANFSTTSRVRYGRDYYDERMRAIRAVSILGDEAAPNFAIVRVNEESSNNSHETDGIEEAKSEKRESEKGEGKEEEDQQQQQQGENASKAELDDRRGSDKTVPSSDTIKSVDPLRWFGVLVPPALKVAQAGFTQAVEGPLPRLSTLAKQIRQQELEIGRLRKKIKKEQV